MTLWFPLIGAVLAAIAVPGEADQGERARALAAVRLGVTT